MPTPITAYHVVVALIRQGESILVVKQQGPEGPPVWSLPGGGVEPGEALSDALAREVREETGLEVLDPGKLIYAWQTNDEAGDESAIGFVFEVDKWTGDVCCADPDGFVKEALFLPVAEAIPLLGWTSEPIIAYLRGEVGPGAVWLYRRNGGEGELVQVIGGAP
jgi:8-oxo-dGTP diphosphatase